MQYAGRMHFVFVACNALSTMQPLVDPCESHKNSLVHVGDLCGVDLKLENLPFAGSKSGLDNVMICMFVEKVCVLMMVSIHSLCLFLACMFTLLHVDVRMQISLFLMTLIKATRHIDGYVEIAGRCCLKSGSPKERVKVHARGTRLWVHQM